MPTFYKMLELYGQPISRARFDNYLALLQGNTNNDIELPVSGYNPMAKQHVFDKLAYLKSLKAEEIVVATIADLNGKIRDSSDHQIFKVAINLSDDLQGGWTNRFTSDYDSKFRTDALFKRHFCVIILWATEEINADIVQQRTLEYCYRAIYRKNHPKPLTLVDHIAQERFVAASLYPSLPKTENQHLVSFYNEHQQTTNYSIIFNFLYGDEASASLGFPSFGIPEKMAGFRFAGINI